MGKDVSAKPKRETPPLVLTDAAAQHAAAAFGPAALEAAARSEASRQTTAPVPGPVIVPNKTEQDDVRVDEAERGGNNGATQPSVPVIASAVRPAPAARPSPEAPTVVAQTPHSPIENLRKITVRIDESARTFLKRFRRRPYQIAETLVAEYALERLFASESLESVSETLRGLGHGLRRSSKDVGQRWSITVYADPEMLQRLESLRDDYNIAMGSVGAHAIDWLRAHQSEEQIVAALKERGYGLYRTPRAAAT